VIAEGKRWTPVAGTKGGADAYEKYIHRFGPRWVESKIQDKQLMVRLRTLDEFRHLFERPNQFLLIRGEEITDSFEGAPVHMNATNLKNLIPAQGGNNIVEVMQNNIQAMLDQEKAIGRPILPHINHPNFGWALTAEDMLQVRGEDFFEVYNGHPAVRNFGDLHHASTERMWDIMLTRRLGHLGIPIMYGLATDDSHDYHQTGLGHSNLGRGWIMVRSGNRHLTPENVVNSIKKGDFYASSGVELEDIQRKEKKWIITIQSRYEDETFTVRFIGTRKGYPQESKPVLDEMGNALPVTRIYPPAVGKVLLTTKGWKAVYPIQGDEIYIRAVVTSSRKKTNPYARGEFEQAWIQPIIPE
jgi:hypothetical protein